MRIVIRPYDQEDKEPVTKLHWSMLKAAEADKKDDASINKILEEAIAHERIFVAKCEEEVVGYALYGIPKVKDQAYRSLNYWIWEAQHPEERELLEEWLKEKAESIGGEVRLEYFTSSFSQPSFNLPNVVGINSYLQVDSQFRRQGIGRALAARRIDAMKNEGASAAFTYTWEGSGSEHLYRGLGFEEIIAVGPILGSGGSLRLMGKKLK